MSRFATVLRTRRVEQGLRQKDLAARLGISPQYLNDIERGRRAVPPDPILARMASVLDCSLNELHYLADRIPPALRGDVRVKHAFDRLLEPQEESP